MGSYRKDPFFNMLDEQYVAVTFDDVRLRTEHADFALHETDLATRFSRNIPLRIPIVSAAMDRVTEASMAGALSGLGGMGVIHRGLSAEEQASEVKRVKFHLQARIDRPITARPEETIHDVLKRREEKKWNFHTFPVIDGDGKIRGILTSSDFNHCDTPSQLVRELMRTDVLTMTPETSVKDAYAFMQQHRINAVPLTDDRGVLVGMYTFNDVRRIVTGDASRYALDEQGRLRVAIAIGSGDDAHERAEKTRRYGVDAFVIDFAHGDQEHILRTIREIKKEYPNIDVVVGNVSEGASALRLVDAGADGIKVGQGPGSICTTRPVSGIGCPQVTAINNCEQALRGSDVPICADGGIVYSGDITVAIAAGAHTVMLGRLLAGTDETPGDVIFRKGIRCKEYRGMGSLGAMKDSKSSRSRYGQKDVPTDELIPEGVEGIVPYQGPVSRIIHQLLGGLRSGMHYTGSRDIETLRRQGMFYRITGAGLRESHPHDITITEDAPNYHGGAQ